jgi:hypothetical protein
MTFDDTHLDPDEVVLQDGTSVTLQTDALWVTVDDEAQITAILRIIECDEDAVSMAPVEEADEPGTESPIASIREATRQGELYPLDHYLDNQAEIRAGTETASIPDMVMDVWGEYTEFQEYGPEYVSFLIEGDIREIRGEMQNQEEIDKEFADIAINAIRALEEFGSRSAHELVRWRLEERMAGDQEDIIERYTAMWTGHLSDPTEFKR